LRVLKAVLEGSTSHHARIGSQCASPYGILISLFSGNEIKDQILVSQAFANEELVEVGKKFVGNLNKEAAVVMNEQAQEKLKQTNSEMSGRGCTISRARGAIPRRRTKAKGLQRAYQTEPTVIGPK